jgi:predicted nucleic acid-binding protein
MKTSPQSSPSSKRPERGLTLDCGALVALERRDPSAIALLEAARRRRQRVTVPAPVLAEWWRDDPRQRYIQTFLTIEPTTESIAKQAGVALGRLREGDGPKRRVSAVDAIVMASAATRGEIVYTSDARDLRRLQASFPRVDVVGLVLVAPHPATQK